MKKGRIVQFGDNSYGYEELLLGLIPMRKWLSQGTVTQYQFYSTLYPDCKYKTLESLQSHINNIEKAINCDKIKRVVKETKLEKALK